jgi:hypothetical protein
MMIVNHALRVGICVSAAVAGAVHAYLYADGYRDIPLVGPAFLVQGSVLCALAVLILVGGPAWLNLAAAAISVGSLAAFALSRTVGLFGFTETGWEPAPYALLSVAAETLVIALVGALLIRRRRNAGVPAGSADRRDQGTVTSCSGSRSRGG